MSAENQTQERRKSGRPKGAGSTVGRDGLVRHCIEFLKTIPPGQLTFSSLARYAGVAPGLMNYHFKDRSDLVGEVLRVLTAELGQKIASSTPRPAAEDLRLLIGELLQVHVRYPYFHELMFDELIRFRSPSAEGLFHDMTDSALAMFDAILQRGVAEGSMRAVNTPFFYTAVLGMCSFAEPAASILGYAAKPADGPVLDRYAQEMADMALAHLSAPAPRALGAP